MSTMTSEREAFEKWAKENGVEFLAKNWRDEDIMLISIGKVFKLHKAAHLDQPAQAVDVVAIREVIADMDCGMDMPVTADAWRDKLTRALTSEKAADARRYVGVAEVIGGYEMGDAGAESRVRWLYNPMPEGAILYEETVPASPAPDKE